MATPPYQPFLNKDFTAIADSRSELFAGPTATMAGLPAAQYPAEWRSNTASYKMEYYRFSDTPVLQGQGQLLLYSSDKRLLATAPAALYLHLPSPRDENPGNGVTVHGLKRWSGVYDSGDDESYDYSFGIEGGTTVDRPRLNYLIDTRTPNPENGYRSGGATEAFAQQAGEITAMFLLLERDAYDALTETATTEELATATPADLTTAQPERELVWLEVPMAEVGPISLSSTVVEVGSRLIFKEPIRFATKLLSEERETAAWAAFRQKTDGIATTYFDEAAQEWVFGDNSVLDKNTVAESSVKYTTRKSFVYEDGKSAQLTAAGGVITALRIPDTGKYYVEFQIADGSAVNQKKFIAVTTDEAFRKWGGYYGLSPCRFGFENDFSAILSANRTIRVLLDRDAQIATFMAGTKVLHTEAIPPTADRLAICRAWINAYGWTEIWENDVWIHTTDAEFAYDRPMDHQCLPQLKDRRHQTGPYPYEEVMDWLSAQASDANKPVLIDRSTPDSYQFARESVILSALSLPETGKFYFEVDLPTDVGYPLAEGETEVASGNPYVTLALVPERFTPSLTDELRATGHPTFHLYDHLDEAMAAGTLKVLVDKDAGTVSWQLGELTIGEGSYITTAIPQGSASRVMAGIVGAGQAGQYGTLRFRFREADFTGTLPEGYQPVPWSFSRA